MKLSILILLISSNCFALGAKPEFVTSDSGAKYHNYCDDLPIYEQMDTEFERQERSFSIPMDKYGASFSKWTKRDHEIVDELIDRLEMEYQCVFL